MKILQLHNDCTHDKLINYGFKKSGMNYYLEVPIYFYNSNPVISIEFFISILDHYIGYDVIDNNSDMLYTAYYDPIFSNDDTNIVLRKVKSNINKILSEMKNKNIIKSKEEYHN